jgi:hypothetical protein
MLIEVCRNEDNFHGHFTYDIASESPRVVGGCGK